MAEEISDSKEIANAIAAILGDRLLAVYRFGSDYVRGPRAVQMHLLVVVDQLDRVLLDQIVPIAQDAQRARIVLRVDTTNNLVRGVDAFPAFSLELLETKELITGTDVLAELEVDTSFLRLRIEQSLRGITHDLIRIYLKRPTRQELIRRLRQATHKLVYLLKGALIAGGMDVPSPPTPDAIITAVISSLRPGGDPDNWKTVQQFASDELPLKEDGPVNLYSALLHTLESVTDVVDRMETG